MGRSFVARRPFDELRTSLHRRAGSAGGLSGSVPWLFSQTSTTCRRRAGHVWIG